MSAIKKFRKSIGQTQEEFAAIIHVSKVNYSKKENEKVKFSLNEAILISNHFNKSIEDIFGEGGVSQNDTLRDALKEDEINKKRTENMQLSLFDDEDN